MIAHQVGTSLAVDVDAIETENELANGHAPRSGGNMQWRIAPLDALLFWGIRANFVQKEENYVAAAGPTCIVEGTLA